MHIAHLKAPPRVYHSLHGTRQPPCDSSFLTLPIESSAAFRRVAASKTMAKFRTWARDSCLLLHRYPPHNFEHPASFKASWNLLSSPDLTLIIEFCSSRRGAGQLGRMGQHVPPEHAGGSIRTFAGKPSGNPSTDEHPGRGSIYLVLYLIVISTIITRTPIAYHRHQGWCGRCTDCSMTSIVALVIQ